MVAGVTLLAGAVLGAPHVGAAPSLLSITGYLVDGSSPSFIDRSAAALSSVGVDGVVLDQAGSGVSPVDASALTLLARSHARGLRADLLVSNYSNALGDFSSAVAARLLLSPSNIRRVAAQLAHVVANDGWNGLSVDLESLDRRDATGLVDFLAALRHDLAPSAPLSVDVGAAGSRADYLAIGFDLAAIAHVVDRVAVMTYDEHGPWSGPGPIGALAWQGRTLAALLAEVPASEVDLGVAGYGYTWPAGRRVHDGVSVGDARARSVVARDHAKATWVPASGEWTATLSNGTTLWWSDARSYQLRVALARRDHLHGLAVWQLASSDPLTACVLIGPTGSP